MSKKAELGQSDKLKNQYREAFADRMKQVLDQLNQTPYAFQKAIGAESRAIYNVVHGRNLPGTYLLSLIKNRYQMLNIDWLLTGSGEMWLSDDRSTNVSEQEVEYQTQFKELQQENSRLKNQLIETQEKYSECLERLNAKDAE